MLAVLNLMAKAIDLMPDEEIWSNELMAKGCSHPFLILRSGDWL